MKERQRVAGLDTSRFPVEGVSWLDAARYCNKLPWKEGLNPYYKITSTGNGDDFQAVVGDGYRLPTEAEWEYACRAGTSTRFAFGHSLTADLANIDGNHPYPPTAARGRFLQRPETVGAYPANAFGLFDMHGNVLEACWDWIRGSEYPPDSLIDPIGFERGRHKAIRGGCWQYSAVHCGSAWRNGVTPLDRNWHQGFRVARTWVATDMEDSASENKTIHD